MAIKVKKRNFLKKKKIKAIKSELGEYSSLLEGKKNVEILEAEPNSFILVDGRGKEKRYLEEGRGKCKKILIRR